MGYVTNPDHPTYMSWLHGAGTVFHHHPVDVMARLSSEMRRVAITPRARGKSPMARMRAEMAALLDATAREGRHDYEVAVQVLASLDLPSLERLNRENYLDFPLTLWNEIAPHLTADHMKLFCRKGLTPRFIPYPRQGYTPLREDAAAAFISHIQPDDKSLVMDFLMSASEGRVSIALALEALRHWLPNGQLPPAPDEGLPCTNRVAQSHALLRVLCAFEGGPIDQWIPKGREVLARALDLTRTRHGQLQMRKYAASPEAVLADFPGYLRRASEGHVGGQRGCEKGCAA